jgi:hypothetical protein
MVNICVAFGPTSTSYFIACENRMRYNHIPDAMKTMLAGGINTPIHYAAMGEGGRWFLRGINVSDRSKQIISEPYTLATLWHVVVADAAV